jgi:hypothetical protein
VEREARHLPTSSLVKAEAGIEEGGGGAALGQAVSGECRSRWGLGCEVAMGTAKRKKRRRSEGGDGRTRRSHLSASSFDGRVNLWPIKEHVGNKDVAY